jgi:hypothetical protein
MVSVRTGAIAVAFGLVAACATTESAHQNFKNILNAKVGTNADSPSSRLWRPTAARISVKTLANGNIEEGYTQYRACRYYFEIDESTRKIVSAWYEGATDDCIVWP